MHRQELLRLLSNHSTRFMDEAGYINRAKAFVRENPDSFERHHWPIHITGSAWVVSPDRTRVLMMHHRKLDQWFQPGGHADGDADILRVALRETAEESGVDPQHVRLLSEDVFDVDIHSVPAHGEDPPHDHIDVRFLVEIDDTLPVPGSDESHDVMWVSLLKVSRFNNNRSTHRMLEKTRRLRNALDFGRTA
jgi:8-oxo-dGTP pyrophosphatase MutT (NUDIX family)